MNRAASVVEFGLLGIFAHCRRGAKTAHGESVKGRSGGMPF